MDRIPSSRTGRAVVAGHICLDIIPGLSHVAPGHFAASIRPGHLVEVGPAVISTGGPVSNTGLALHKLGITTQLMAKVGADLFGRAVQDSLRSYGEHLAAGIVVDERTSTSYSLIISPSGEDRTFLHHAGANDTFCAEDVQYRQVGEAELFHFGYPPLMRHMYASDGAELAQVFQRAKATGVTTSLDMAFPDPASPGGRADWKAILQSTLPFVDIFMPSIEELLFMLRRETFEQLLRAAGSDLLGHITPELVTDVGAELLGMGVKVLVLKLGERGLYLRSTTRSRLEDVGRAGRQNASAWADCELWAPCFEVDVVGTTGSGDTTIAGFLSALLRGLSPHQAVTAALAVGACNVEAADALSGLRSWEATLARIAGGWTRRPLSIAAPGWCWDPNTSLWRGPANSAPDG